MLRQRHAVAKAEKTWAERSVQDAKAVKKEKKTVFEPDESLQIGNTYDLWGVASGA